MIVADHVMIDKCGWNRRRGKFIYQLRIMVRNDIPILKKIQDLPPPVETVYT